MNNTLPLPVREISRHFWVTMPEWTNDCKECKDMSFLTYTKGLFA